MSKSWQIFKVSAEGLLAASLELEPWCLRTITPGSRTRCPVKISDQTKHKRRLLYCASPRLCQGISAIVLCALHQSSGSRVVMPAAFPDPSSARETIPHPSNIPPSSTPSSLFKNITQSLRQTWRMAVECLKTLWLSLSSRVQWNTSQTFEWNFVYLGREL